MTTPEVCGLCNLPAYSHDGGRPYFGGSADGVLLHHGDYQTQTIGWSGDQPISTTCYRAWTIYGFRPEGYVEDETP